MIEIISVIIIISVLGIICSIVISNVINENKNKAYDIQINNIKMGAQNWTASNLFNLPEETGESITITLWQLKQASFVDTNIKNPITGIEFPNDMLIVITKTREQYEIEVLDETGTEGLLASYNQNSPIIYLNGEGIININQIAYSNIYYEDTGAIAYSSDGTDISSQIVRTITRNGVVVEDICYDTIAQYKILYSITNNDITMTITRIVNVIEDMTSEQ